jgi:hypothetical protein
MNFNLPTYSKYTYIFIYLFALTAGWGRRFVAETCRAETGVQVYVQLTILLSAYIDVCK